MSQNFSNHRRNQVCRQGVAISVAILGILCSHPDTAQTGKAGNQYTNSMESVQRATLLPPGVYPRWYNFYYDADTSKDANDNLTLTRRIEALTRRDGGSQPSSHGLRLRLAAIHVKPGNSCMAVEV
jgi:hypothetical protein